MKGQQKQVKEAKEWSEEEFWECEFGDKRRTARAVKVGEAMCKTPKGSLPKQMGGASELRGAYRLLNNEEVTFERVIGPHIEQTRAKMMGRKGSILLLHDTSYMTFTHHPRTKGLGQIGKREEQRGFIFHSVLAVEESGGMPIGIAHAEISIRTEARDESKRGRSKGAEGRFWEGGVSSIGNTPSQKEWIHISDRESDVFSYWKACVEQGGEFVVRARWDRKLEDDLGVVNGKHLIHQARQMPANPLFLPLEIRVKANAKNPARQARLTMSWQRFRVHPPQYSQPDTRGMALTLLRVWEGNPPAQTEPIEWLIVTSLEIVDVTDAQRVRDLYACRWAIEDFHMCIKTGCAFEHSQLDDARDLMALLGFVAPIAVRLLQLRYFMKVSPDAPATDHEDPLLVALVAKHFRKLPSLTILEFWKCIARLGGYVGNWLNHPPGWRIIWSGYLDACRWLEGARHAASLSLCPKICTTISVQAGIYIATSQKHNLRECFSNQILIAKRSILRDEPM